MHAKPYPELNCVGLKCTTRLKLCSTVVKGFVTKTYLSVVFSCLSQLPTKIIKIKDINLLFFIRNNKTLQVKCLLATDAMFFGYKHFLPFVIIKDSLKKISEFKSQEKRGKEYFGT